MRELIARAVELGGLPVDDVLALLLPLFEQVSAVHETGQVAPLRGLDALRIEDNKVGFDPSLTAQPRQNRPALAEAEREQSSTLTVRRGADRNRDLSTGSVRRSDIDVSPEPGRGARIVAGWQRWEHLDGTHDELTDIGSLGELLAALCCGLDLAQETDAAKLSRLQRNLFPLARELHPVVAAVASSMIAPMRHDRAQDLSEVIERLSTYRDQPEDFDLDRVLAAGDATRDRREAVLTHLRDRLFDLTRRNPLLHFRATQRTLNLTQASVPLVLDVRSIRPAQLFTWGGPASDRLVAGKSVELGSLVRWEDAPYASAALDALISTARRDRAEYGQNQLRLVVAFLRWHNVKDDPDTAIPSPLVLAPVTLTKQRGVRDSFRLHLTSTDAEVNPVLRHELRERYGFSLPETIDLADPTSIESLRKSIEQQARTTQPGVSVETVDKPRIELIRSRAQTALQSYRRRRPSNRPLIGRRQYAYSYTRPGWAPLGIQIFRDRIERLPLPISVELGDAPVPRQTAVEDGVIEREMFTLNVEGTTNPYSWEIDLCAVTLANFNYRTLTLVRDYEALIEAPRPNPAFDELFSTAPRDLLDLGEDIPAPDRYLVVPADGSQLTALSQARAADNFVIQGPPGTGKSQTITNLIADYLARGKRVLFVCQKRAALDVVHARLRSQGLDEICTLIHDSQQDKKEFVHNLRDTYEGWLAATTDLATLEASRNDLLTELAAARQEIENYETALVRTSDGVRVIDVLDRLIALREASWGDDLDARSQQLLPTPSAWFAARPVVDQLVEALHRTGSGPTLAGSAVRILNPQLLAGPHADALIAEQATTASTAVQRVLGQLAAGPDNLSVAEVSKVVGLGELFAALPEHRRAELLRARSTASADLAKDAASQQQVLDAARQATAAAAGWRAPLSPDDAQAALAITRRRETSMWRVFSADWRRIRAQVTDGYPEPAPSVTGALELLVAKQDADRRAAEALSQAQAAWGHAHLGALRDQLATARRLSGPLGAWRDALANDDDVLESTTDLAAGLADMTASLDGLVVDDLQLIELRDCLALLASSAGQATVRAAAGPLSELAASHAPVLAALRRLDADPNQIEFAVLSAALLSARATAPAVDRLDGRQLGELLDRIAEVTPKVERLNAAVITARLRDRFLADVELSQRSVSGMSTEDRDRKKTWAAGRRELEHEFGKVRAYKAIRQLASGEPGAVVAAMRPVWLMSPSSLSDTLPLEATFDVVIFDEASQIPVEEAVPALYRASQVIAVGDRMQLPPTQYFQTRPSEATTEEESHSVGVVLDADSFLAVSSARLPSTMLLWHYRSRYEALIQFSNAAFYDGRLATIPDRTVSGPSGPLAVTVGDRPDVAAAVDGVFARSVSMIRVLDGVYVQRTNPAEATWIAELVREILGRETGQTLGVVAFSEAQQGEIERAIERLSSTDPQFAMRYEAELTREDDGQSVGIFVKNLENVQGDERDVIIMSVCYGPAPDGRMRMNFGPINNVGGEKRLNVIFSRSRQHMVLVSSIDHTAISNTYNDGANTLKNFLRYAAAVSEGDQNAAATVLAGLRDRRAGAAVEPAGSEIAAQIAAALTERGLDVAQNRGQSTFRCDLALRRPGEDAYRTAVLIDYGARLDRDPLDERRIVQPAALAVAGWYVEHVLATDWLDQPAAVLDRLVESATSET